jgi:hypothetical protein
MAKSAYTIVTTALMILSINNLAVASPSAATTFLADQVTIQPQTASTVTFDMPPIQQGHEPYLTFKGRVPSDTASGYMSWAMSMKLNGQPIDVRRMVRPSMRFMSKSGNLYLTWSPVDGGFIFLWYAPDFTAVQQHASYAPVDGSNPCEYELWVGGLLREGENTVTLTSHAGEWGNPELPLHLADMQVRLRPGPPPTEGTSPAPDGDLATIEPQAALPKTYHGLQQDGTMIALQTNGESFAVTSRFSAPNGQWHDQSNPYFEHRREVIEHEHWIEVKDTFRNLTSENLPLMQEHRSTIGDAMEKVWVCGAWSPSRNASKQLGENPTVFATTARSGLGLIATSDVFRVHCHESTADGAMQIADYQFVLKPHAEYTAEWAIIPVTKPDFWLFINTARRMLDANFTLRYCSAFIMEPDMFEAMSDQQFMDYVAQKKANFLVDGIYTELYKGRHPYGTAFQQLVFDRYPNLANRIKRLYPDGDVVSAVYYACFIDTGDDPAVAFPDAVMHNRDGSVMTYGSNEDMIMMIPTLENEYGKVSARNIDLILDRIGAGGVYWDEFTYSYGQYSYNHWDGCSADIDMDTMTIERLKGSMSLMSLAFRAHHVQRIYDRGAALYCNGAPVTRTMAKYKYHSFAETGNATYARSVLLHAPINLGDHLTEVTEVDAYRSIHAALDNGCVYAWYGSKIIPTHETITSYMYPITPIEIHSGYLIGEERIITNRSGLFGWGDTSNFQAHVFDARGERTNAIDIPRVTRDGKAYAEVRIPGGFSVALVRQ